jgi:multimeric flavodoxin WrbA
MSRRNVEKLANWRAYAFATLNYSLGQTDDWMNEIYSAWVAARGILIITPVNWYHAPTALKAMMDRLVCADGGNPDPSSTHGKARSNSRAGPIRSIWRAGILVSLCMATASAPRHFAAHLMNG